MDKTPILRIDPGITSIVSAHIARSGIGSLSDLGIAGDSDAGRAVLDYLADDTLLASLDDNDGPGMVCVDIQLPEATIDMKTRTLSLAFIFETINRNIFSPAIDFRNNLPFTAYKSTNKILNGLRDAGAKFYSPEIKLGFHNDGFFQNGSFIIPRYVSLINLFIGYDSPGNFYWADKRSWPDCQTFAARGEQRRFRYRPTPIIYESTLENVSALDYFREIPVIWKNGDDIHLFLNGEILDDENGLVSDIRTSIETRAQRKFVPQAVGRMILFRNDLGFHSRDIFKDQRVFEGTTRLMLRSFSNHGIGLPEDSF
ncbi:MAG: hypothetical protein HLUCCO17_05320 [Saliniramus fredricksonii]|uniref:Uncharacterized protein n=1 Tax=Saliniramus fredricksonii TaxID=1653334 RepID=A0A0P7X8U4_9HYPH|nr:hypothetical protein [Saliniramus fredricksonii]KPQ11605.1 MAG: hypothetical protein HLUCCO17_05320 [Saliniramus fredricksonii]SCC80375.1 hypothetical protein GA0071312_1456 [Saliniramus fredricksonii]